MNVILAAVDVEKSDTQVNRPLGGAGCRCFVAELDRWLTELFGGG